MPKTRVNCPNCRQPIMADIDQLFDMNEDPDAKQRLLSGAYNIVQCPSCGYQGSIATPIVYHDPQKELLLTYFPPELNIPVNDQERMIGPHIKKVFDSLHPEQRKAYLLRPQTTLTLQGLRERILEADGITREMIQAQQQRLNLIQRLASTNSPEALAELATKEDQTIDQDFFSILNRLVETAMASGDEPSARRLSELQRKLLPITTTGRKLEAQSKEIEATVKMLQDAGPGLTREKLLDMVVGAESELRVDVMASLARPAMDYEFFKLLSDRIDKATGPDRERLEKLRQRLLEVTEELDRQMQERMAQTKEFLNQLLEQENIEEALSQNLGAVDELFVHALNDEIQAARQSGDLTRIQKLQRVASVLQQAQEPPREVAMIEELLGAPDEAARRAWLEEHKEEVDSELTDALTALIGQMQNSEDKEMLQRMTEVYRSVLRFTMEKNLQG